MNLAEKDIQNGVLVSQIRSADIKLESTHRAVLTWLAHIHFNCIYRHMLINMYIPTLIQHRNITMAHS